MNYRLILKHFLVISFLTFLIPLRGAASASVDSGCIDVVKLDREFRNNPELMEELRLKGIISDADTETIHAAMAIEQRASAAGFLKGDEEELFRVLRNAPKGKRIDNLGLYLKNARDEYYKMKEISDLIDYSEIIDGSFKSHKSGLVRETIGKDGQYFKLHSSKTEEFNKAWASFNKGEGVSYEDFMMNSDIPLIDKLSTSREVHNLTHILTNHSDHSDAILRLLESGDDFQRSMMKDLIRGKVSDYDSSFIRNIVDTAERGNAGFRFYEEGVVIFDNNMFQMFKDRDTQVADSIKETFTARGITVHSAPSIATENLGGYTHSRGFIGHHEDSAYRETLRKLNEYNFGEGSADLYKFKNGCPPPEGPCRFIKSGHYDQRMLAEVLHSRKTPDSPIPRFVTRDVDYEKNILAARILEGEHPVILRNDSHVSGTSKEKMEEIIQCLKQPDRGCTANGKDITIYLDELLESDLRAALDSNPKGLPQHLEKRLAVSDGVETSPMPSSKHTKGKKKKKGRYPCGFVTKFNGQFIYLQTPDKGRVEGDYWKANCN